MPVRPWAVGLWVVLLAVSASCGGAERAERAASAPLPEASPTAPSEPTPPALPDVSRLASTLQERLRNQYASLQKEIATKGAAPQRGEAYGAMGRLLLAAELLEPAEPFFAGAEQLMPDDVRWPYYLGHVARLTNRPADAVRWFGRALVLQPEHLPSLVWIGDAYLAQGQPQAAEPHLLKATEVQPQSAAAWFRLGRAAVARGDRRQGIERLERARSLNPKAEAIGYQLGLAYRSVGDTGRAEPLLRRPADAASVVPNDPLMDTLPELLRGGGEFYVLRGLQSMEARKWPDAVTDLRTGAELLPRDASVRVNLGTALFLSGDPASARAAAELAVELDPRLAKARYVLGLIVESERRDAEAIAHFTTAIELDNGYVEALASLGDALRRTGRVQDALTRYQQVLALNPAASQARFGYGMGLVRLERYREAVAWLEEGSRLHADQPGFSHAVARLLAAAPDPAVRNGARAVLMTEALMREAPGAPILETLAMALAEAGRFSDAVAAQQRAIDAARAANQPGIVARLRENLARYERREPCRVPWYAADPVHLPGAQRP
jgi:tetratricopeptide (TPR) repeat protein